MQFLKHAGITVFLMFVAICVIGPHFDEVCVEGRIGPEQVAALEGVKWGKCPSYRNGECRVEVDDRVIIGECSEASPYQWKKTWWKKVTKWFRRL